MEINDSEIKDSELTGTITGHVCHPLQPQDSQRNHGNETYCLQLAFPNGLGKSPKIEEKSLSWFSATRHHPSPPGFHLRLFSPPRTSSPACDLYQLPAPPFLVGNDVGGQEIEDVPESSFPMDAAEDIHMPSPRRGNNYALAAQSSTVIMTPTPTPTPTGMMSCPSKGNKMDGKGPTTTTITNTSLRRRSYDNNNNNLVTSSSSHNKRRTNPTRRSGEIGFGSSHHNNKQSNNHHARHGSDSPLERSQPRRSTKNGSLIAATATSSSSSRHQSHKRVNSASPRTSGRNCSDRRSEITTADATIPAKTNRSRSTAKKNARSRSIDAVRRVASTPKRSSSTGPGRKKVGGTPRTEPQQELRRSLSTKGCVSTMERGSGDYRKEIDCTTQPQDLSLEDGSLPSSSVPLQKLFPENGAPPDHMEDTFIVSPNLTNIPSQNPRSRSIDAVRRVASTPKRSSSTGPGRKRVSGTPRTETQRELRRSSSTKGCASKMERGSDDSRKEKIDCTTQPQDLSLKEGSLPSSSVPVQKSFIENCAPPDKLEDSVKISSNLAFDDDAAAAPLPIGSPSWTLRRRYRRSDVLALQL